MRLSLALLAPCCYALAPTGYLLQELPAAKSSVLLHTWTNAAQTVRANGFSPATEAVGDGAFRMKRLNDELPKLKGQATVLALCAKGSLNFDTLQEPHKSMAKRLSCTKLYAALSAGKGSAIAFVSTWPDHVSIDASVVNPSYMKKGEEAETLLLQHVVETARAAGAEDIRLRSSYQVDGDAFYANVGFYPVDEDAADMEKGSREEIMQDRAMVWRADGASAEANVADENAEPTGGAAAAASEGNTFGAAPAGFEWGGVF